MKRLKPPKGNFPEWQPPNNFTKDYPEYIKIFGRAKGQVLCALLRMYAYTKQWNKFKDGNKFYCTIPRICELTGLDRKTVIKYLKELESIDKIFFVYREGVPRRNWYVLNSGQLMTFSSSTVFGTTGNKLRRTASNDLMGKSDSMEKSSSSTVFGTTINRPINRTFLHSPNGPCINKKDDKDSPKNMNIHIPFISSKTCGSYHVTDPGWRFVRDMKGYTPKGVKPFIIDDGIQYDLATDGKYHHCTTGDVYIP